MKAPTGTELRVRVYLCGKALSHQEAGKEPQKQAEASTVYSSVTPILFQSVSQVSNEFMACVTSPYNISSARRFPLAFDSLVSAGFF